MFSTDSLHIGRAQSDGKAHDWPVADNAVSHSVKCSMVAAADLEGHLIVFFLFFWVGYREDVHPRQADAIGDSELNLMCSG